MDAEVELQRVRDLVQGALAEHPDKRAVSILRAWLSDPTMTTHEAFYASCLRHYPPPTRP